MMPEKLQHMCGWLFILAVLGAFAFVLCSIVPLASAYDLADSSRVTALSDSSGDWSGGISPDYDPDAPPREYDPAEGGLPSDASETSPEPSEELTEDDGPAEGGLPSDASETSQEPSEELTQDDYPAEGGLPSRSVYFYFSDYAALQNEDPAEGGLPSDASETSPEPSEELTQDDDPAEGGLPSDASESYQEPSEQPATSTDLKILDDVYTLLVVLLGSIWALAGLFFAFKLGGAFL